MSSTPATPRRRFLHAAATLAGSAVGLATFRAASHAVPPPGRTGLGLVIYCRGIRRRSGQQADPTVDLFHPPDFLEHVHASGAGGAQLRLGVLPNGEAAQLRQFAESHDLFIEAICSVPKSEGEAERFEDEVRTAVAAGARAIRTTIIPGRRYEYFDSLSMWREFNRRGRESLERAAPIVERHRIPLAVENHKDHRDAERVELFERISSEFVGACLDTGNSFALLEDPIATARRLAPWAHAVHLKDQAVQPVPRGFLLGDIPLGQGCLPLREMVDIIRGEKPQMRFCLELITRDPLLVPVLEPSYWRTFPDLPARDLARTLRFVREHSASTLPSISDLPPADRLALEDAQVAASLAFARDALDL